MRRAAIYTRISDDREGREVGVDDQLRQCRVLCVREQLAVVDRYRDNDISASTNGKGSKPRPEYDRLLADARAGRFGVIVALSSSRLTRRPREHEDLIDLAQRHGIRYLFVRSPSFDLNTADGRQVARTLAAADAGEAERIAERVRSAVERRARAAEPHGSRRGYGITADGRQLVDAEAAEIRRWYAHVLAGGTLAGLAREANRRAPVIRRILLNPRNAGLRILNGAEYPAAHPVIVPRETWQAAVRLLTDDTRRANRIGTARRHLGSGLLLCERCQVAVNVSVGKAGRVYKCLQCWRTWLADPIDAYLVRLVDELIAAEDAAERLLPKPREGVDVAALHTERAAVRANMAELARDRALARGATRAALTEGMAAGEARLAELDAQLADVGRTDPLAEILAADDPVAAWRAITDLGRQQAVIRSLMTVRLGAPIRGRRRWDPRLFMGASTFTDDPRGSWADVWQITADQV